MLPQEQTYTSSSPLPTPPHPPSALWKGPLSVGSSGPFHLRHPRAKSCVLYLPLSSSLSPPCPWLDLLSTEYASFNPSGWLSYWLSHHLRFIPSATASTHPSSFTRKPKLASGVVFWEAESVPIHRFWSFFGILHRLIKLNILLRCCGFLLIWCILEHDQFSIYNLYTIMMVHFPCCNIYTYLCADWQNLKRKSKDVSLIFWLSSKALVQIWGQHKFVHHPADCSIQYPSTLLINIQTIISWALNRSVSASKYGASLIKY